MPSDATLLLLDGPTVETLLRPQDVFEAVRDAFILHSLAQGRVFPIVREPLHTGGVFGIKSGDIAGRNVLGFKASGFWPHNREVGAEPHQATILLFDPHNGRPLCIIDGNAITTARTGAAGAIALSLLARPDIAIRHERDPDYAVAHSDIVVTTTPGRGPLFSRAAVRPGTHLNCVAADTRGKRELPDALLNDVVLCADDCVQAREVGECQWAPELTPIKIGELVCGHQTIECKPTDITVFDMTGLALQDLTTAVMALEGAIREGKGSTITWPW